MLCILKDGRTDGQSGDYMLSCWGAQKLLEGLNMFNGTNLTLKILMMILKT